MLTTAELYDPIYIDARAAFGKNVDIVVTRDWDARHEERYAAKLVGPNGTIPRGDRYFIAYGEIPEEALENLHELLTKHARTLRAEEMVG